jgi:predicted Ser/Thr protein kinase
MTSVRVPKHLVGIIDKARAMDPMGLSQGQMIAKIVIEALSSRKEFAEDIFSFTHQQRSSL